MAVENSSLRNPMLGPQRPKILVVDDQPLIIRTIHKVLSEDHQVFMSVGGLEALSFCEKQLPDLLLLDLDLPDIGGLEVCRRLKQSPVTSEIPIIFVTATGDLDTETACWQAGAVDFVTKPINPATLKHRVKAQLTLKFQSDKLRNLAYTDGLTEISNRRYLDEQLAREWRLGQRYARPISAILIDIDHFKQYNDTYGHLAGDECLKTIASCVRQVCKRPSDIAARYGGEEFCCILPETDQEGAIKVAELLVRSINLSAIEHAMAPNSKTVTVSMGIATVIPTSESPNELLSKADLALYKAKDAGRNRIEVLVDSVPVASE